MNTVLAAWNIADESAALAAMLACCGAQRWAQAMVAARPISMEDDVLATADRVWATMQEQDWRKAFACHPRIGSRNGPHSSAQSAAWSAQEQSSAAQSTTRILDQLARGNAEYEARFGFTYIVCATGKSAEEMLAILQRRLTSDQATELREAAEQQRQITQIRLRKWMAA